MTEDVAAFLILAIAIDVPRYAITLFQSCQNLLLYQRLHFFLMLTTKQLLQVPNLLGIRSLTRPKSFTLDVGTPRDIKKLTVRTKSLP